jgi:arylsulfatase A-like enzyme
VRRSIVHRQRPAFPLRIGLAAAVALALAGCLFPSEPEPTRERPNILLVVADDLGYSDLGCYGSEIPTPNLDALAKSGSRATDFYVSPRGAPTRAMLLTGVDNHVAGFGSLRRRLAPNQEGKPGYEGRLTPRVVTVASLLRDAGYHTAMAGKWELGEEPENLPVARGFERSFALHDAAASHWADRASAIPGRDRARYTENGREVTELPADYFSTRHFTDFVIESIEANRGDGRPFFAYLAYQAPHGPLAVPDDWRDRAAGRYDTGYDAVRDLRLLRMKRAKLVQEEVRPYPGIPTVPAWSDLSDDQKRTQARKMELYAAMVENLDFHLGRLFDYLREIGEYRDTLIVFLSDNGTEPGDRGPAGMDDRDRAWYAQQFPESGFERWGHPGAFVEYGAAWAQVGMVPFRLFKGTMAEGGIRSPLVASGPGVKGDGRISHAVLHVMDLTPTFLDLAQVPHPREYRGRAVARLQGESLLPLFARRLRSRRGPHEWLGFELGGDRALRRGPWKLVRMRRPFGTGDWRLYRIGGDPAELYDRSQEQPERREALIALWERYARENGVVLPDPSQKSSPSAM